MADLFIRGSPQSITARYFSSNPSDSRSLRTPCHPPACAAGRQGITPAFGYSAPHPSAEGTLTLLIHALPSAHYGPVRLPPRPPLLAASRPLPSPATGLPRLPASPFQRAVPITPADRTGACVDYFAVHTAFPAFRPGRHPHYGFRGLLRLHSRYGPPDRSTAQGGLCRKASAWPVALPSRLPATRSNRQLSGWNPPPLVFRAVGAHCIIPVSYYTTAGQAPGIGLHLRRDLGRLRLTSPS